MSVREGARERERGEGGMCRLMILGSLWEKGNNGFDYLKKQGRHLARRWGKKKKRKCRLIKAPDLDRTRADREGERGTL